MKIRSQDAVAAAPLSTRNPARAVRLIVIGTLLASSASIALAQAVVPGSTNTPQQEQTTNNAPATPSPLPPAPQADDVAQPATGSAVIKNAPRAPQDDAGLQAIVVTATKRETNLQRTPIAISVANTQA